MSFIPLYFIPTHPCLDRRVRLDSGLNDNWKFVCLMTPIMGLVRMFKDRVEYGIHKLCEHTPCLLSKYQRLQQQEEQRKLKREKLLEWSWTTWQFLNPTQNSASPTAAASSLLSPILIRRRVCTPPYQSPRARKHICLLFIQPLLFHLHFLCSAVYILEEPGSYTYTDPLHHFQIKCIHRITH